MEDASRAGMCAGASIDDYRLIRTLGDERVFLAHDTFLDRAVVLSLLPDEPEARAKRLAAARAIARVAHKHVGAVHRVRDGGTHAYVVSEFARGRSLGEMPLPLARPVTIAIAKDLAAALSAMHSAAVAHGDVRAANVVVTPDDGAQLVGFDHALESASAVAKRADVDALVALIVSIAGDDCRRELEARLLRPFGAESAASVESALSSLDSTEAPREPLPDNPYRGLEPFDEEHASDFFGREREVETAIARLREQPWLVIAGRSGTGKSSFVRAGIAPPVSSGVLGERARWDVAAMTPGRRPLDAFARALSPFDDHAPEGLAAALAADSSLGAALLRRRNDRGLLIVVDQLEELLSWSEPRERERFCAMLMQFGLIEPGVRLVATVRGDFLERLPELGAVGEMLARAVHVLPPMSDDGLRSAILAPAATRGVTFESEALVDTLLGEVRSLDLSLPLLSFALRELWETRDISRSILPRSALERIGGAVSALARHGDTVLARMTADERTEAQRILLALAAGDATWAQGSASDLVPDGREAGRRALEAMVRGRLVVAGERYSLAHAALATAWPRLRRWLDDASLARAVAARLESATREWVRLGRGREALGSGPLLRDARLRGAMDSSSDDVRAFVVASGRQLRRAAVRRAVLRFGAPVFAILFLVVVAGTLRADDRHKKDAFIAEQLSRAEATRIRAGMIHGEVETKRREAFARFDADDSATGEQLFAEALALAARESDAFADASTSLSLALARDPGRPRARAAAADLAFAWLQAAERDHNAALEEELMSRLLQFDDDGSRRSRLAAPARVSIHAPADARLVVRPILLDEAQRRIEGAGQEVFGQSTLALPPGAYIVVATAPGRVETRLPLLLGRGEETRVEIRLPNAAEIPPGFVYVPAGDSLLGSADREDLRRALHAAPEHKVHVGAFLIAQHEVTYARYIEFLSSLQPDQRRLRGPGVPAINLSFDAEGTPTLALDAQKVRPGQTWCKPQRGDRTCQDWLRFPVAEISLEDARAYAAWLSRRIRGGRLCREQEWERAARGADGRIYPHGDELHATDANFGGTFGPDAQNWGFVEAGGFAFDRSPFGVLDMVGNVSEWTESPGGAAARGGNWAEGALGARAVYRRPHEEAHGGYLGFRVCADAPLSY